MIESNDEGLNDFVKSLSEKGDGEDEQSGESGQGGEQGDGEGEQSGESGQGGEPPKASPLAAYQAKRDAASSATTEEPSAEDKTDALFHEFKKAARAEGWSDEDIEEVRRQVDDKAPEDRIEKLQNYINALTGESESSDEEGESSDEEGETEKDNLEDKSADSVFEDEASYEDLFKKVIDHLKEIGQEELANDLSQSTLEDWKWLVDQELSNVTDVDNKSSDELVKTLSNAVIGHFADNESDDEFDDESEDEKKK